MPKSRKACRWMGWNSLEIHREERLRYLWQGNNTISPCSSRHREGKEPGRSLVYAYERVYNSTKHIQLPAPELIVQAAEAKAKAESLAAERAKELQFLQEENNRLRNEIKVLQEYKEKAHRELCRVRDEQKTIGKIKVNTEL